MALIGQAISDIFENNCHLHVYSPGAGANYLLGSFDYYLKVYPFQTHRRPNLIRRKIGQGQPRVIIYINLIALLFLMLHAKFQDDRENEILKVF